MSLALLAPWAVLFGYCVVVWRMLPARVTPAQFFAGNSETGAEPGLWLLVASAGSTLDSTFASAAKLAGRDWDNRRGDATSRQARFGRGIIVAIAILGNLPLLAIYFGEAVGPAIIAATTISGTMVMGLAPIFLLSFLPTAGRTSFHLTFWPGLAFGVGLTFEGAFGVELFSAWVDVGSGKYADDLGVNIYGLMLCTVGYLAGAVIGPAFGERRPSAKGEGGKLTR